MRRCRRSARQVQRRAAPAVDFLVQRSFSSCAKRMQFRDPLARIPPSSDAPLEPADYASAEIFCDVHRRHLIELGIIDLLGDLLSPSVIFAVDHELITVGSTLRQHGFVDALDWDAEFRVDGEYYRRAQQVTKRSEEHTSELQS